MGNVDWQAWSINTEAATRSPGRYPTEYGFAFKVERKMSKSKLSDVEIMMALKQVEAGRAVENVARECGVSKQTVYAWKYRYGGTDVPEDERLGLIEDENRQLKWLVTNLGMELERLLATIAKADLSS